MPRARVITFDAVSADGFTEGFEADQRKFYEIVARERDDVALAGSNTIIAVPNAVPDDESADAPVIEERDGPVLAVIDSRGRFRAWDWLRRQPPWREVVAIGSEATLQDTRARWEKRKLQAFFTRGEKVDLADILDQLSNAYGAKRIRIESGGTLNGLMMQQGLIDEAAMLVHPVIVGGQRRTMFRGLPGARPEHAPRLKLRLLEELDGDLIHIRYDVARP
jgi:2,5-diamino-6-(ribosylamino)-4(3H)-pyrimidinone 5'-phosphate reductase